MTLRECSSGKYSRQFGARANSLWMERISAAAALSVLVSARDPVEKVGVQVDRDLFEAVALVDVDKVPVAVRHAGHRETVCPAAAGYAPHLPEHLDDTGAGTGCVVGEHLENTGASMGHVVRRSESRAGAVKGFREANAAVARVVHDKVWPAQIDARVQADQQRPLAHGQPAELLIVRKCRDVAHDIRAQALQRTRSCAVL